MLTEEQKRRIEDLYNYYDELYSKKEDKEDKNYCLGKCAGINDVLYIMGYETKIKYSVVTKEEE